MSSTALLAEVPLPSTTCRSPSAMATTGEDSPNHCSPGPVLGITETTSKDWAYFMVAGAPGVLSVPANSPIQSLEELVAKAKAAPKSVKAGAGLIGGLWHTKLLSVEKAAGVTFGFTPFQGSQPSQLAALSGEVECVLTSISEQADLIRGGKLRPLAMIESESYTLEGIPEIPAATAAYPAVANVPVSQFLGFALPADTPAPVLEKITAAFEQLMAKPSVADYAASRQLSLLRFSGDEATKRVAAAESAWCWLLQDLGIAVKSPESFGIPKP
jgi:tripartite-type tricarboxylate transporter receptor subunit TctC